MLAENTKNSKITNGTITCDNTGKWFINITFQLIFDSIKEQENLGKAQRANKKKLAKNINKKIKNKRKDFNNKLVLNLVMNNHTIVNSDISYKSLMKSKLKGHAKAWSDNSLGNLRLTLKFKAKKHNVKYAEINERILVSTETCSV